MNSGAQEAYGELKEYYNYVKVMLGAKSVMTVDMMVSMPKGALKLRQHDLNILHQKIHSLLSDDFVKIRLEICEESIAAEESGWDKWDKANIREMRRIHDNYAVLPAELYARYTELQAEGMQVRRKALESGDKKQANAHLKKTVRILSEVAERKQTLIKAKTRYGALLHKYIDGLEEEEIDSLNGELTHIIYALHQVDLPRWCPDIEHAASPLSKRDILWLGTLLLQQFGFDFHYGRLIVSQTQPHCTGTGVDARVLVRCSDPPRFFRTLSDVLYQGGRGLYMQNIPREWANQPVGSLSGMPMVGACSILLESFIGTSHPFFAYLAKEIKTLPSAPADDSYSAANLYKMKLEILTNHKPGDMTRNLNDLLLNVLITGIERDLINGTLSVEEIEERWRADIIETFEVDPGDNDIHYISVSDWFAGRFGVRAAQNVSYLTAAQLYTSMQEKIMDFDHLIAAGEFQPVTDWLTRNIFSKAHHLCFSDLLKNASSSPNLKTEVIKEFIDRKAA